MKLKAFMLSLMMAAMMLPIVSFAQNDNIIQDWDDENGVRDFALTWTITNNSFGTSPLGSGLLILTAVGAGYAVARRRRNRKNGTMMLLALAMIVGMTGCRKKIVEPIVNPSSGGTTYTINLNTGNGSKVNVTGADVDFTNGDKLLVAHNGRYVGALTYNESESKFEGTITTEVADPKQKLYFYFLGNKIDVSTLTPGTSGSTSCTVNISDQTGYPALPVISFSASNEDFSGSGSYSAALDNKCSLMKFDVISTSTRPICITGMNNKVTVDFGKVAETGDGLTGDTDHGFSYSVDSEDGGLIKMMGSASAERWVIVLPQAELAAGGDGTAYTNEETQRYKGNRPALDAISSNQYLSSGVSLNVNTADNSTTVDLSKLVYDYRAIDGETLTGTLSGNYKISIADGAEVTLNNATINGTSDGAIFPFMSSVAWAGITCLGDATIIMSGVNTMKGFHDCYPGIQAAKREGEGEEYTLTISGTGSLTASSNGYGAGIGGGTLVSCGNIIINGGTITATGGENSAGIGNGMEASCGIITINGGTITATGGNYAAGIGSGNTNSSCGAISISGGDVTATGGQVGVGDGSGAGIGSGSESSCGNITISGGTITATGGLRAAGIGSGFVSSVGNITITNTVTRVTTTGGNYATNNIGKGYSGTCGTVTIGGVEGAISTSPYTYEPAPQGAISGKFSVSSTNQVYFSQGNLKYSNGTWSFHTNQYDMCFTSAGDVSTNYNASGTFDLFGYGTSGYDSKYPYLTGMDDSYYDDNLTGSTGSNYDWGVHNTISNGGTGWRTLTIGEWDYLLYHRTTTSEVLFAKAKVNDVAGLIILPDDWSTSYFDLSSVANSESSYFSTIQFDQSVWTSTFEAHGAVFLPVLGYREVGAIPDIEGYISYYWSSTYYGYDSGPGFNCAYYLTLEEYMYDYNVYSYVATNVYGPVFAGAFVRLVKDAN